MPNNQNILEAFGLLEELDEQAGETTTGGYDVFTIINKAIIDINSIVADRLWYKNE